MLRGPKSLLETSGNRRHAMTQSLARSMAKNNPNGIVLVGVRRLVNSTFGLR